MENDNNGETDHLYGRIMVGSSSPSRSLLQVSSPPSTAVGVGVNGGVNYILHTVSKFDTLAGVAIKYGVEVADIKRLNGLVTDLQMFALKTLQIPLPGRHPPSPILSNGHNTPDRPSSSEKTPSLREHFNLFDSFQSLKLNSPSERKVSPAMSSLQGYYRLTPDQNPKSEGFEMANYRKGGSHYLEDGILTKSSSNSAPPLSHHRKSKTVLDLASQNGNLSPYLSRETENGYSERWIDKLLRRPQKSEADFSSHTPEKLLREENSSGSAISAITGQRLALRPKSASRTVSGGVDGDRNGPNPGPMGLGDSSVTNGIGGVRKSSSTPSLQETDNGGLSSLWPTSKWPDFQALSNAAIARPIFDGLPKPTSRKNKTALD